MNGELIHQFREKANEACFCKLYSNVGGKNKWNIICSAMDWITVAVAGINFYPTLQPFGECDETTMYILNLFMRVAIIKEGIEQLHRVFMNTNEVYRNDDKAVWRGNPYATTDNKHFATLRSCFAAHPINLKLGDNGKKDTLWYASWPYASGHGDLEVNLGSNDTQKEHITINIKFSELEEYAKLRYQHLNDFISMF
jgi:hypothetical protein